MIKPVQSDEQLLRDVHAAPADGDLHLWWLGQSGFLVKWRDHHVLLDPYLSDSLTRKYAGTDKPHVRMTERVVDPARLDFINLVTSSHNHTDHLDAETLCPLLRVNPQVAVLVPEANRAFAADRLRVSPDRLLGIDAGESRTLGPLSLHAVPAAHERVERDEAGRCRFLGYVLQLGDWTVYHSGDTVRYEGMAEQLAAWPIDVALLPINGSDPRRRVAGNLSGREAAELAREVNARLVIPCHYEMFTFNTADPSEFERWAGKIGQPCRVLKCGERWSGRML